MPGKESGDDPLFYEVNDRADHIGKNQGCNQGGENVEDIVKEEKEKLTVLKSSQKEAYQNLRKFEKELNTVCSNVEIFLEKSRFRQTGQEKDMVRS